MSLWESANNDMFILFTDGQFPVDILQVEREHDFLDKDSLQPLIR